MNYEIIPYQIYTDGAAKGLNAAKRAGGWAFILRYDGRTCIAASGSAPRTTNQRMELQAVIEGIRTAHHYAKNRPSATYEIYSDSAYLINCYEEQWYVRWEENGWKNSKGETVSNSDLWLELIPYFRNKRYSFYKVQGHADDQYNNEADQLAQEAASRQLLRGDY